MLRIARLEYEFMQRQKLTEKCNGLQKQKEAVLKNTEETQSKLDNVGPMLTSILSVSLISFLLKF